MASYDSILTKMLADSTHWSISQIFEGKYLLCYYRFRYLSLSISNRLAIRDWFR